MDFIDCYKILGIEKTATEANIKKAYRKLARKLHPDLNPNDKEGNKIFQAINETNEVLSVPKKRKKHNLHGKNWQHAEQYEQQAQQRRSSPVGQEFTGTGEGDFSSFFESMFGGSERLRQTQYQGQEYNAELTLSLIDAMETHQQTLTVNGKNIRITIPAGIENGQVIKLKGDKIKRLWLPGVQMAARLAIYTLHLLFCLMPILSGLAMIYSQKLLLIYIQLCQVEKLLSKR